MEFDRAAWDRYWHFDRVASCLDEAGRTNYDDRIAAPWRAFFAALKPDARVLDLCTGNGAIPLLALEVSPQFQVTGVDRADIDPARFAATRAAPLRHVRFQPNVSVEELPFADASFDAVTSQYGIEYSGLDRSLAEAARILAPGGRLRLSMHAAEGTVAAETRRALADADFILSDVDLPGAAARCFAAVTKIERSPAPSTEDCDEADRHFATFQDALGQTKARYTDASDRKMLETSTSVIVHTFQNRAHFELPVLLEKVSEVGAEIEAHRSRQRALVDAAVSLERLAQIAERLRELGLTQVRTTEQRSGDRFLAVAVEAERQASPR